MLSRFFIAAQTQIISPTTLPQVNADPTSLTTIFNIIFGVIGALSFLFIVIGGLQYIMSQGDSAKLATAKNRIVYSAIGIAIAAFAAAIVNFVLGKT